jgi:hypothetical protein
LQSEEADVGEQHALDDEQQLQHEHHRSAKRDELRADFR